jgi:hypothetical protein
MLAPCMQMARQSQTKRVQLILCLLLALTGSRDECNWFQARCLFSTCCRFRCSCSTLVWAAGKAGRLSLCLVPRPLQQLQLALRSSLETMAGSLTAVLLVDSEPDRCRDAGGDGDLWRVHCLRCQGLYATCPVHAMAWKFQRLRCAGAGLVLHARLT